MASNLSSSQRPWSPQAAAGIAMMAPALAGLTLFIAVPFLFAVAASFTDLRMGSPLGTRFAGVEQYARLAGDPSFRRALLNNLLFVVVVVPTQTVLALALAVLVNQRVPGMAVFRTVFFMPVVFPMALIAVVWTLIYAPGPTGLMNGFLDAVTPWQFAPRDYLHNQWLALPAIMVLSIWQGVGFQMVILLAGLQGVREELYQAAAIDGAGPVQRFFHVTLPQLRNPLILTGLVTTVLAFRVFDQVQIMTQGGPLDATATVMYETVTTVFRRRQVGLSCAMTVVFFLIVLLITWLQHMLVRQEREVS